MSTNSELRRVGTTSPTVRVLPDARALAMLLREKPSSAMAASTRARVGAGPVGMVQHVGHRAHRDTGPRGHIGQFGPRRASSFGPTVVDTVALLRQVTGGRADLDSRRPMSYFFDHNLQRFNSSTRGRTHDGVHLHHRTAGPPGHRAAVLGVRQLGHAVQGVQHAGHAADVQEKLADAAKVQRAHRARAEGGPAHPVGQGRRLRGVADLRRRSRRRRWARSTPTPSRTTSTSSAA